MFAVVNPDGTLDQGTPGTASVQIDTGQYVVTFPQSALFCARVVTMGDSAGAVGPVNVIAVLTAGSANSVLVISDAGTQVGVATFDDTGAFADQMFHLAVLC